MRILIIGGGMITREVLIPAVQAFSRRHGRDRLLIASRRGATLRKLAAEFPGLEFQPYPDPSKTDPEVSCPEAYREALAALEPPAVVIVATPDHLHTGPVLEAIERGFDCVVQKPLCLSLEEGRRIAAAAESKAAYIYTDYHKRHDHSIRALRHRYLAGELGEALCASAHIEERREMPLENFARWARWSNSFDYIGCHYVDVFYYVTGLRPIRVTAYGQKKLLPSLGRDIYDAVQALVEWENGSVLYVQTSWVLPDGNPNLTNQGFQLTGTQGEYRADHADRNTNFCTQQSGYDRFNPYFCKPYRDWDNPERVNFEGYGIESVIQPLEDILALHQAAAGLSPERHLAKRRELLATLEKTRPLTRQALVTTAVLEATHHSLAAGSVPVPVEM